MEEAFRIEKQNQMSYLETYGITKTEYLDYVLMCELENT